MKRLSMLIQISIKSTRLCCVFDCRHVIDELCRGSFRLPQHAVLSPHSIPIQLSAQLRHINVNIARNLKSELLVKWARLWQGNDIVIYAFHVGLLNATFLEDGADSSSLGDWLHHELVKS